MKGICYDWEIYSDTEKQDVQTHDSYFEECLFDVLDDIVNKYNNSL